MCPSRRDPHTPMLPSRQLPRTSPSGLCGCPKSSNFTTCSRSPLLAAGEARGYDLARWRGPEAAPPSCPPASVGLGKVSAAPGANVTATCDPGDLRAPTASHHAQHPPFFLVSTTSSLNAAFPSWDQKRLAAIRSEAPWARGCVCKRDLVAGGVPCLSSPSPPLRG